MAIVVMSEYLTHEESVLKLALVCKKFYINLQHRYKKLCSDGGIIDSTKHEPGMIDMSASLKLKKTVTEQLIAHKNYMSIFGKMNSKCLMRVDLTRVKLDPKLDDIISAIKRRASQN